MLTFVVVGGMIGVFTQIDDAVSQLDGILERLVIPAIFASSRNIKIVRARARGEDQRIVLERPGIEGQPAIGRIHGTYRVAAELKAALPPNFANRLHDMARVRIA